MHTNIDKANFMMNVSL